MSAARALLPRLATLPGGLKTGRELLAEQRRSPRPAPLPTGLEPLDRLLVGGLPRGRLVELVGARSCGRFAALLGALATATGGGEPAALVDLGDHLDPQQAARWGVDLERLLWLRPATLEQALGAAETALGAGFPLVVLDLGAPPLPGRRPAEAAWLRLARAAEGRGAALLVSTPYRMSATATAAAIVLRRPRPRWSAGTGPRLLAGLDCRPERAGGRIESPLAARPPRRAPA